MFWHLINWLDHDHRNVENMRCVNGVKMLCVMQILKTFRFWNAHPDIIWRRNYVYGVSVKITLYNAFSKLYYNHVIG